MYRYKVSGNISNIMYLHLYYQPVISVVNVKADISKRWSQGK